MPVSIPIGSTPYGQPTRTYPTNPDNDEPTKTPDNEPASTEEE